MNCPNHLHCTGSWERGCSRLHYLTKCICCLLSRSRTATTTAPIVAPVTTQDIRALVFLAWLLNHMAKGLLSLVSHAAGLKYGRRVAKCNQGMGICHWCLYYECGWPSSYSWLPQDCPTNVTSLLYFGLDIPFHWHEHATGSLPPQSPINPYSCHKGFNHRSSSSPIPSGDSSKRSWMSWFHHLNMGSLLNLWRLENYCPIRFPMRLE